jgi:hypothetical protein
MKLDPQDQQRVDAILVNLLDATTRSIVELRKNNVETFFDKFQELAGAMSAVILKCGDEQFLDLLPIER